MITPLPSLDRTSPTFKTEADAFFADALPTFSVEAEAARVAINAAEASTAVAATLASTAISMSNFKGAWSSLSGSLAVPASVLHNKVFWLLLNNLADVTTSPPGVAADWVALSLAGYDRVISYTTAGQTIPASQMSSAITLSGGATSITLPLRSAVREGSVLSFRGVSVACTINRQGVDTIFVSSSNNAATSVGIRNGDEITFVAGVSGWIASGTGTLGFSAGFAANLSSNGWAEQPNGLITQWGTFTTTTTQPGTFSFPIAFPSQCLQIVPADSGASVYSCAAAPLDRFQFSGYMKNTSGAAVAGTARFIAYGK